jgi:hypothetical protein
VFDPPLIIILSHEEIGIPNGASSFDLIANLFCHQHKITKKSKVMQNNTVPCTINQQSSTMCHEVYCLKCNQPNGFIFNLKFHKKKLLQLQNNVKKNNQQLWWHRHWKLQLNKSKQIEKEWRA